MHGKTSKRVTVYFDPALHTAIRRKSVSTHRTISEIVNDAVRQLLHEDLDDIAACDARGTEPVLSHAALLKGLRTLRKSRSRRP